MINVEQVRDKILRILKEKGPALPVTLASAVGLSPIFTSAILSELLHMQKIKISSMKIGSSPLYFLPGQESQLENFDDYLGGAEKTAYLKLKENKILEDEIQEPAIKVALRAIKDFAVPFKFRDKLYWKYFLVSNEEVEGILVKPKEARVVEEKKESDTLSNKLGNEKDSGEKENRVLSGLRKPKVKKNSREFFDKVSEFLFKNDIEFLEEISVERKEVIGKIRINSDFGKLVFLLIAKDKKKPQQADIMMAYQKVMEEKLPCYLLTYEEPSKKMLEFLKDYGGLVRVGRIV